MQAGVCNRIRNPARSPGRRVRPAQCWRRRCGTNAADQAVGGRPPMYDFVDRSLVRQDRGVQLFVWAMRQWAGAALDGRCVCRLSDAFVAAELGFVAGDC